MLKRFMLIAAAAAIALSAAIAGTVYYGAMHWRSQAAADVEIAQGSSVRRIADELARAGVIRTPRLFEVLVRIRRTAAKLRAGTYRFDAGTTLLAALGKIERGEVYQWPLTVIEGWTIKEIAAALANQPCLASPTVPEEFVRLANDPAFIGKMGFSGAVSLEGHLFPDTYFVTKPLSAEALITRMTDRFRDVWKGLGAPAEATAGWSEAQLVTLASIVEKETGAADERTLIASVFYNRLKIGMPLQSDPTIIYGLPNYDGNIRREDITNPHPYNTYVHAGLPPGPICNPGKASLDAVLHPAETDYIFFVSKNNGTHLFTKTNAEHAEAVRRYQIEGQRE